MAVVADARFFAGLPSGSLELDYTLWIQGGAGGRRRLSITWEASPC